MKEVNVKDKYVIEINKNINNCIKNKAMLSFKYEYLNFWINFTQITIIIISGSLTLMESIKSYYNISDNIYEIINIFFTFLIGLIMAIYRFFKMDDRKENICNLLNNYTFIINKFKKIINKINNFTINNENIEEWNNLILSYQNETVENYISIQENFDNIFSYKDKIFYKNKFKKLFLKQEAIDNEIETIHFFKKHDSLNKYKNINKNNCCFCFKKSEEHIDYDSFIEHYEPLYIDMCKHKINNDNNVNVNDKKDNNINLVITKKDKISEV